MPEGRYDYGTGSGNGTEIGSERDEGRGSGGECGRCTHLTYREASNLVKFYRVTW